jgi:hypothetical protein
MNKEKTIHKVLAEISRILIGVTFVFSGVVKAIDPVGGAIKIEEYFSVFGLTRFAWIDTFLSFNQAALEFTLGFCLLMAVYRKVTTCCLLIFMGVMTPLTLYLAIFNPVADCGCFGDALVITNWETFLKNVILLAASVVAYSYHKRLTPCYTYKTYWFIALFAYVFCIAFCFQNYNHLPIVDFRPYKVGENIPKLMDIPPDAPQDEYLFVYENKGVRKAFTSKESPAGDTSWTYVESKLIRQGFIPKVSAFELYDASRNDVAPELLSHPKLLFWLIAPDLKKTSDEHIDEINNIYDYAQENGFLFYGITASGENEIAEWAKNTGADYPFLLADDVLLKTMIRSNPGMIVLKQGTILSKWHHNDLPTEDELAKYIADYFDQPSPSDQPLEQAQTLPGKKSKKEDNSWVRIIAGFALPLLLIWGYDFVRNRTTYRKKIYKRIK